MFFENHYCYFPDINTLLGKLLISSNIENYNPNSFQIEEYVYTYIGYSTSSKNYIISFNNNKKGLRYPINIIEKLICGKQLLMLMNEMNSNDLNMYNYSKLVRWIIDNSIKHLGNKVCYFYPKGWFFKN